MKAACTSLLLIFSLAAMLHANLVAQNPIQGIFVDCRDQSSPDYDWERCPCQDEKSPSYASEGCAEFRSQSWPVPVAIFITLGFVAALQFFAKRAPRKTALEFAQPSQLADKSKATSQLLARLSETDSIWDKQKLKQFAASAFQKFHESYRQKKFHLAQKLLREDLYNSLAKDNESESFMDTRTVLLGLSVEKVHIVQVQCYKAENQDEFSAWIRATARRCQVDSHSGKTVEEISRGPFEQYWSFQRGGDSWALCRMQSVQDGSYLLGLENYCERIAQKQQALSSAPTLIEEKSGRAELLLSVLEEREVHWDEHGLRRLVSGSYVSYYQCLFERDFSPMKHLLSKEFYVHACGVAEEMKKSGIQIKAKDLCVREVEFVLVKNRKGAERDEFTAYVSAHGQIVQLNPGGHEVGGDSKAKKFEEYLTFVHSDGWILEEMVPPDHSEDVLEQNDIDEDDPLFMLDWYFKLLPPDREE